MTGNFDHLHVRRRRLAGSLLLAAAVTASLPAVAQEAAGTLEEVIVTAQKRQETAQDVPIAVSAFSSERLDRTLIEDATDIQFSVPNAMLVGNERFTVRGIGNNALSSTADNGVASFINGAAIGYAPYNEFFDLERVEVLRGPQGTLYGRNTTGGAINIITQRPTDKFEGDFYAQFGNFSSTKLRGSLNIPLSDTVKQRFAADFLNRGGYTENEYTGHGVDGRHQWAVRSSTLFTFSEATEANLVLAYYKEDSTRAREVKRLCTAIAVLGCSPNTLGFDSPDGSATLLQRLLVLLPFVGGQAVLPPGTTNIYAGAPNPTDLRKVAADTDPTYTGEQFYGTLDFTHKFGDYTFQSVTGYSWGQSEGNIDYDNAALPLRFTRQVTYNMSRDVTVTTDRLLTTDSFTGENETWTQEFRLLSSHGGTFDFTAGVFGLKSTGRARYEIWHPSLELFAKARGLPQASWHFDGDTPFSQTKAWAAFGETYFRFSDATKLTLGARYTDERKSIQTRTILLGPPPPYTVAERDWQRWTGKIAIDHRADLAGTDETLFYGSLSTGYKGGGLNPGNTTSPDFKPETVDAIELGMKNTMLGNTLQANFAAFYYDYTDLQLAQRIQGSAITSNADAKIWGLEAEFAWAPSERWLLETNLAYLDTEIGDFLTVDAANPAQSLTATTPQVPVNLKGNEVPYSPRYSIKFGAQYSVPLASTGWDSTFRVDAFYQDTYWAREFNTPTDRISPWSTLDLQARFSAPNGKLSVQFYVKNLLEKDNVTNLIIEGAEVGSYRNVRVLEPRTMGVAFETRF